MLTYPTSEGDRQQLADQLGGTIVGELVDQPVGELWEHGLFPTRQGLGAERMADQPPMPAMVGVDTVALRARIRRPRVSKASPC